LAAIEGGNVQVRRVGKWFFTALGSLAVLLAIGISPLDSRVCQAMA
jgi:hypothetical protein